MKRRKFLQVAGVTSAGVVAAGCAGNEPDRWAPEFSGSEESIPGIPTYYASTCKECPAGCGILVKTRENRPIKIEGNPQHPVNRGRLCARGQAALQGLYDPDRVIQPMKRTGDHWAPITWEQAETEVATALTGAAAAGRDRVAFISGAGSGPLDRLSDTWLTAFGSTKRLRYEAFAYEPVREANRMTFGVASIPNLNFAAARYILSFGADFLETWISPTSNQIGFAESHSPRDGQMAKFVAVESRRGNTGFSADEWVSPKPGTEHLLALGIARVIAEGSRAGSEAASLRGFLAPFTAESVSGQTGVPKEVIERLATEFAAATPSLAVGGGVAYQHAAATQTALAVNILNIVAGNVGRTVTFPAGSVWDRVGTFKDLSDLVAAMAAGSIDVALVQGTNPAYTYPGDTAFATAFAKVKLKVSFSSYLDDTAALCDLILPDHHSLESWDIVEPMTGVSGLVQPTVRPIHSTRQTFDVLLSVARKAGKTVAPAGVTTAREMVAKAVPGLNTALMHGGTWTASAAKPVRAGRDFAGLTFAPVAFTGAADGLVLMTTPSPMLHDGRGGNKPWLQEVPDPAIKITWQTWAELHPETAARLGFVSGDLVELTGAGQRKIHAIVVVYPGVHRDVVAVPLGRGHNEYGRYAKKLGSNALHLLDPVVEGRSGGLAFLQTRVSLRKSGHYALATTEGSARQMGRGISRLTPFSALAGGVERPEEPLTQPEKDAVERQAEIQGRERDLGIYAQEHPKWEMTIDLSRCTGCSACVTACHAENNIPTVGEDQVIRSREMSWIRIERYYEPMGADLNTTDWTVAQIPMLCQQCANAPCEPVCPVYAAYHTPDGLNGQIYNRCVGTRYCANNCPYKVRYFNFWDYSLEGAPKNAFPGTLALLLNPDVTVRTKGVMEKCTFCVQRIRFAQTDARVRGATLEDGAIDTACAQTCPSGAITFGNAKDGNSRVSRIKTDARAYTVFEQLNTKPGVTYLSRVVHTQGREA